MQPFKRRTAATRRFVAPLGWVALGLLLGIVVGQRLPPLRMPALPTLARATATPAMPLPTPRPTAAPTPAGAGLADFPSFPRLLLDDPLDSAQHSSMEIGSDEHVAYSFSGAAYHMRLQTPQYQVWSMVEGVYDNVDVQTNLRFTPPTPLAASGVMLRYQDDQNYYLFNVSSDGRYAFSVQQGGQWRALIDWTRSTRLKPLGQSNQLRVATAGARIRLFINGVLLDEVYDTTFDQGKVALALTTYDEGDVEVAFDHLRISGL